MWRDYKKGRDWHKKGKCAEGPAKENIEKMRRRRLQSKKWGETRQKWWMIERKEQTGWFYFRSQLFHLHFWRETYLWIPY